MNTVLIQKAASCLFDVNEVTDSITKTEENKVKATENISTNIKRHWSVNVSGLGGIIGVVVAIAAFIFKDYELMFMGVLLGITGGVGAYFIYRFLPNKTIEGYIDQISNKIRERKILFTELSKTNQKLTEQLVKVKGQAEVMEKDLAKTTQSLKIANKNFVETMQKLTKIQESVNAEIAKKIEPLQKEIERLGKENARLSTLTKDLDMDLDRVETSNSSVSSNIELLHKENASLVNSLNSLREEETSTKFHHEMQGLLHDRERLGVNIQKLETAEEMSLNAAKKAEEAAKRTDNATANLRDTLAMFSTLKEQLIILNQHQ